MTTERPVTAYAKSGRLDLPMRGRSLSDEDKAAARQAVADARAARGQAAAASGATPGMPAAAPAPATAAAPPALPAGPLFAVSTSTLRTRAEAEQLQAAMAALLRANGAADVKLDMLPQGDDWRVVALPFPQRADAEKGRALLASRGMRVTVLDF